MKILNIFLEPADYEVDFEDLRYVRNTVFVDEQRIPPEIEFDQIDRQCHHVLARDLHNRPIGTVRLTQDGRIGRMAVLLEWRNQGVGGSMLRVIIEKARSLGMSTIKADAQVSAVEFYKKFAFQAQGETFIKAGIPHQLMQLKLQQSVKLERRVPDPRPPSIPAEQLHSIGSTTEAILQLINASRRQLYIFSQNLEYDLYGQSGIVEAMKKFALRSRGGGIQVIIQDPDSLRGVTHPLLNLAQRLPAQFFLRTPMEEEYLQNSSAFIINDSDGYLFRLLGDRYEGHWSSNLPARNRQLMEEFEPIWQRSRTCSEFRALNL